MPSVYGIALSRFVHEAAERYYVPEDSTDMLCRWVNSPLFHQYHMDYETYFYEIITGTEAVDVMFEQFREDSRQAGLAGVIEEVNRLLPS
jgi:hypothetical protein